MPRVARPLRGWTKAAYPSGSAIARPVPTIARSPGPSVTSLVVTTSAPASPGCAYDGSGTPGSSRRTITSSGEFAESVTGADLTDMGRSVVVTGANSGIGLSTAVELAQHGYDVIGTV